MSEGQTTRAERSTKIEDHKLRETTLVHISQIVLP
jgi:hypothetical protein